MSFVNTKKVIMMYVFLLMGMQHLAAQGETIHLELGLSPSAAFSEVQSAYEKALETTGSMSIEKDKKDKVLRRLQHLFSVFQLELKQAEEQRNDLLKIVELKKMLSLPSDASIVDIEKAYQRAVDSTHYMNISGTAAVSLRTTLKDLYDSFLREKNRVLLAKKRAAARHAAEDKAPTKPARPVKSDDDDEDGWLMVDGTGIPAKL